MSTMNNVTMNTVDGAFQNQLNHMVEGRSMSLGIRHYVAIIRDGMKTLAVVGSTTKQVLFKAADLIDQIVRCLIQVSNSIDEFLCVVDVWDQRSIFQWGVSLLNRSLQDEIKIALKTLLVSFPKG